MLCPTNMLQKWWVHFSPVEFFKQHNVYGFRCQCSGVRKIQRIEHRKQMTACDELSRVEDKEQSVSVFCHLTPDTRNLKPKIGPCFVNYLRDATLGSRV